MNNKRVLNYQVTMDVFNEATNNVAESILGEGVNKDSLSVLLSLIIGELAQIEGCLQGNFSHDFEGVSVSWTINTEPGKLVVNNFTDNILDVSVSIDFSKGNEKINILWDYSERVNENISELLYTDNDLKFAVMLKIATSIMIMVADIKEV